MTEPAHVLIVDHDDRSNGLAASTLAAAGFHVAIAASNSDTVAAIERRPPDIVVVAQDTLSCSEDALAGTLLQHYLTRRVPLVLLTSGDQALPGELLRPCGRVDKPIAPDTLVEIVHHCLKRGSEAPDRTLSSQTVRIQEAERRKLSAELHDDIAQVLGNLVLMMDTCLALAPDEAAELRGHLANARDTAREGFRRVQGFSIDLRPPMLDDLGLAPTIGWYAERFAQDAGINVRLELPDTLPSLDGEQETAIFRIVQETLRNVRRHAVAHNVGIVLRRPAGLLHLAISDDGVGFDPEEMAEKLADGTHLGIAGMRYRVALLNGSFRIESESGHGTTVTVEIPVSGC